MQYYLHYIDESKGFELIGTAWSILTHTCFVFAPFNITISMADFLLGGLYMLLAGYVLRKIFWW